MLERDKERNEKYTMYCDRCQSDFPESFDTERKAIVEAHNKNWVRVEKYSSLNYDYEDICPDCN